MTQLHQKIDQLNNLLIINYATEKVYLDAFAAAQDIELKQFFKSRAFQRNEFCRFLAKEIRALGGTPMLTEAKEVKLKKQIPDLRKVLATKNATLLVTEIKSLKKSCLMYYNKVLSSFTFPNHMVELLEYQKRAISNSVNTLGVQDRLKISS